MFRRTLERNAQGRERRLAEYAKLKEEQTARITLRDHVLNFNVVALGVTAALSIAHEGSSLFLLVIPWFSIIFGWAYVQHEEKITAIAAYLRRPLEDNEHFAWEVTTKQASRGRLFNRWASIFVLLFAFSVPAICAPIIWFYSSPQHVPWLLWLASVEGILGLVLAGLTIWSWLPALKASKKSSASVDVPPESRET